MTRCRPDAPITRYLVALVQMIWPVIWTLTSPDRTDALFYIFAALAVLGFYRDWAVLAVALSVLAIEWLTSALGSSSDEIGWILFEVFVLMLGCTRGAREMDDAAGREATLEQTSSTVQQKVENRTRALQARSERYRALVENTEAIPFEFDVATHQMIYIAPKAMWMFGATRADLHEPGFFTRHAHPDDLPHIRASIEQFMRGARAPSEPLDCRFLARSRVIYVRIFFSSGEGDVIRGVTLDITRQLEIENELRQAQKLESVGRLAAGVAHEINTPVQYVNDSLEFTSAVIPELLAVIAAQDQAIQNPSNRALAANAQSLAESSDVAFVAEELPKAVQRAVDGIRRIALIVKSMNAFARNESLAMVECDLRHAIESALAISASEYKHVADVALVLGDVPPVMCHLGGINQVILNLVVNAAHAISEAAVEGRRGLITVELRRLNDHALISVRDTGPGIPVEVRERVFEPFFSTKPVGKGSGQGLAIARAIIVDKHRGSLTFETDATGTTFHVRIPISNARELEVAA